MNDPAFPVDNSNGHPPGVSLREWFAGQALVGYLAAHAGPTVKTPEPEAAAKRAFQFADAMIRESQKS